MSEARELSCKEAQPILMEELEARLSQPEVDGLRRHLERCPACRAARNQFAHVHAMMQQTLGQRRISDGFEVRSSRRLHDRQDALKVGGTSSEALTAVALGLPAEAAAPKPRGPLGALSAAPWWGISVALHVLIIVLLGLITMTVGQNAADDTVIVLTSLERRPVLAKLEEEQAQPNAKRDILKNPVDVAPTDPASAVQSNVIVPPEILALAELGDHFETINLDRPDTHSAFGNPDARMFHSVSGNAEPEGGGGMGGANLLDDLIGVGGASSPGTGGGWGGGNGLGAGSGNGSGKGSFGQRSGGGRKLMVMRHGGGKATESAVDKGLEWLARHQEADGHWDAQKHEATCKEKEWADVGMTGIALLAFLGAGHSERIGKYKDNVQRGVHWLLANQQHDAKLKGAWVTIMYSNGLACLALCEAYGMGRNPEVKKAAQEAVEYIQEAQHQYMAWNYYADKDELARNDTSVTGWQVMALKSAKIAGLKVDTQAFQGALNWLDLGQELPKDMREAPSDFEGGIMHYGGNKLKLEGTSMSMTAAAAMMRLFLGQKTDHPGILGPCNLMLKTNDKRFDNNLPCKDKWPNHPNSGIDYYYWYYGTFATFQMGGEHWKTWNEALKSTVLPLQRKDGDADGSWDPIGGGRIPDGGRVFSTSLAVLCLEVYYRYLPMYR